MTSVLRKMKCKDLVVYCFIVLYFEISVVKGSYFNECDFFLKINQMFGKSIDILWQNCPIGLSDGRKLLGQEGSCRWHDSDLVINISMDRCLE
jgi:hypothetical protein